MKIGTIKLILTVISGICWTAVYIEGVRIGFRDKSYAIPFYALALNFAWELLHTIFGFRTNGVSVQNIFNAVWFTFDTGILYTYFKYGRKYFPRRLPGQSSTNTNRSHNSAAFIGWSILGLVTALCVEYAFIEEFGVAVGAGYSAFLQNLLMSILFIAMLIRRGSREGQSLLIAISKWIGTFDANHPVWAHRRGWFSAGKFLNSDAGVLLLGF